MTPWTASTRDTPFTVSTIFTMFELAWTYRLWIGDVIQLSCHPLLLLPSVFPCSRVFCSESAVCIRWPKYWSFSYDIQLLKPPTEFTPSIISIYGLESWCLKWWSKLLSVKPEVTLCAGMGIWVSPRWKLKFKLQTQPLWCQGSVAFLQEVSAFHHSHVSSGQRKSFPLHGI